VTFDLEHTLDARLPGDHRVQVWSQSGHLPGRRSNLRKSLQTDGRTDRQTDRQTDRRRTPCHCISSFLEWAKNKHSTENTVDNVQRVISVCDKQNNMYVFILVWLLKTAVSCKICEVRYLFITLARWI